MISGCHYVADNLAYVLVFGLLDLPQMVNTRTCTPAGSQHPPQLQHLRLQHPHLRQLSNQLLVSSRYSHKLLVKSLYLCRMTRLNMTYPLLVHPLLTYQVLLALVTDRLK